MVSNIAVARKLQDKQSDAERYYSQKARAKMDTSDFAGPHRSFPIMSQQDVFNAARLIGQADDPAAVKAAIIRVAKRKGFKLPDSWQKEEDGKKPKESAALPGTSRLATMITCWLEDGAISLNGRQYPREAVDRLIQSAQVQLSDPNALPLTCYLSHQEADKDNALALVGRITRVWREGTKALASIDIPNTHAGRDLVTLTNGQYIKSTSLRASNAEMRMDKDHTFPQVGGAGLKLEGIDFTTTPGLAATARIIDLVLAESAAPQTVREVFHTSTLVLEKEAHMREEYIQPMASGDSPSVDGAPGRDYPYPVPAVEPLADIKPMANRTDEAHKAVHDHLANVLDATLAPMHGKSQEQARRDANMSLQEAGRKLALVHAKQLAAAHDLAAYHAGMSCEGAYEACLDKMAQPDNAMGNDGMQDGDDDDRESARKETRRMTQEEAARLLSEAGYKIEAPKTQEQILQEKLDAMQAAFDQKLAEMQQKLQPSAPAARRKSLVEGANVTETPNRPYYRNGDYLREQLRGMNREELLDRSRPLPEWMDPERALKEFQLELLGMYDAQYKLD